MQTIYLTRSDHQKLAALLKKRLYAGTSGAIDRYLETELARAQIVEPQDLPADAVTMNSQVRFTDLDSGEHLTYWLTFPEDADLLEKRISVLSPVGSALIGYRTGDIFPVQTGPNVRRLKIMDVLHQPEPHGVYA